MKKAIVIIALIVGCISAQAQEKIKKDIYIQKGDVVEATLYYDNGDVSQKGFYTLDGKLTGEWLSFNRKGVKTAKAQYDNGNKVGTWFFWSEDKLTEVDYLDSRVAGVNIWKNEESKVVSNK